MTAARGDARNRHGLLRRLLLVVAAVSMLLLRGPTWGLAWAVVSPPGEVAAEGAAASRRVALGGVVVASLWGATDLDDAVWASGGATAGKYSTIPSAKRRFYGRVRQGIYQFLQMEMPIKAGNLQDPLVEDFFAKNILKQVGGEQIRGCQFADCKTKEKRTSRWNDFKLASDLLASGFRYDASDVNDFLPQVRLIRSFAKKVEKINAAIGDNDVKKVQKLYTESKKELDMYTEYVELAHLDSEDYTHPWDTRPQVVCQGSFCT